MSESCTLSKKSKGCSRVGNAGGVRVSLDAAGSVRRAVVLTSVPSAKTVRENPYHDRIEGDVLVYTGAGREGDQSLAGVNRRLTQQLTGDFPIYGFILVGSRRDQSIGPKRWRFLGLLEYLRRYPETQVDTRGESRKAWVFELRIHTAPAHVPPESDALLSAELPDASRRLTQSSPDEQEIAPVTPALPEASAVHDPKAVEQARGRLLAVAPERFEHIVRELLSSSGFERATVTRFTQDGGIDVNAYASKSMWPLRDLLVQVQAKRWLHTVGRKEVAELRGSLMPHARGAIVTTSYFSKAALSEASESGKVPIVLVDGHDVANLVLSLKLAV